MRVIVSTLWLYFPFQFLLRPDWSVLTISILPSDTQEAVCARTAYKRHFTAKCHNIDSLAIWKWFLIFLYIRFHNSFSFWGSGLGQELDQFLIFGPLGCLGALYGHFIWPTLWTLNNAWHVQGYAKYDMWHVTHDLWHVACYKWHVTCDAWHVTCDRLKCDTGWMHS